MKKSLFDILQRWLAGACFLDLFAGTGSVGLEALSRGASRVVFVEQDAHCARALEENLAVLGFSSQAEVLRGDVLRVLDGLHSPFDLIFLGPPYRTSSGQPAALTGPVLEALARQGILKAGGWIISQHHAKETFRSPAAFSLVRQEKYGDSRLTFLKL